MAKATGHGSSIGEALRAALSAAGHPPRPSYTAKGATAQYKHLMKTEAGRQALDAAGLTAVPQTRRRWAILGNQKPGKANAAKIHAAYESMRRGSFPASVKAGKMEITGRVGTGTDVRNRGSAGQAPLRIDLSRGNWARIDGSWWDDDVDDMDFSEVVGEDLVGEDLEGSDWWYFPGTSYTITLDF
jgi:hypothetical protein